MELRNVRTFARIAEVGSFTRVAGELGYTQSAVTMQVKQLENELDCMLFERLGRKVRLTPEGERLIPIVQRMLQAADEATRITQAPDDVRGTLRIGAIDSMLVSDLPSILIELTRTYPNVSISTHQGSLDDEFSMLRHNDIDVLLFLDKRINYPEWIKALEAPGAASFFAASDNPMAGRKQIPIEEVLEQPLYLTERNISYRTVLEQAIYARGLDLTPRIECGSTEALVQLCEQTGGITYLPRRATDTAVQMGKLVPIDVDLPPLDLWYQLVYHKNKVVTPQIQLFVQLVSKRLDNINLKERVIGQQSSKLSENGE